MWCHCSETTQRKILKFINFKSDLISPPPEFSSKISKRKSLWNFCTKRKFQRNFETSFEIFKTPRPNIQSPNTVKILKKFYKTNLIKLIKNKDSSFKKQCVLRGLQVLQIKKRSLKSTLRLNELSNLDAKAASSTLSKGAKLIFQT